MNKNKMAIAMAVAITFSGTANAALHISRISGVSELSDSHSDTDSAKYPFNASSASQELYKPEVSVMLPSSVVVGGTLATNTSMGEVHGHLSAKQNVRKVAATVSHPEIVTSSLIRKSLKPIPVVIKAPVVVPVAAPVMSYGVNVPIKIALKNLLPSNQNWKVRYDDKMSSLKLNWDGGNTWEGVLNAISKANGISFTINKNSKILSVASSKKYSDALALPSPELWTIKKGSTLRKTIKNWGKLSGWNVFWDKDFDLDFPIVFDAKLIGTFDGANGVLHTLLNSVSEKGQPISAEFYSQNRVVYIKNGGFQQGLK